MTHEEARATLVELWVAMGLARDWAERTVAGMPESTVLARIGYIEYIGRQS